MALVLTEKKWASLISGLIAIFKGGGHRTIVANLNRLVQVCIIAYCLNVAGDNPRPCWDQMVGLFRIRLLTRDIEEISRESEKLLMDRYVVMGKFVVSLRSPEYEKWHMLLNTMQ